MQCPAGVGGRCRHVAATLFQVLNYIELGLSDIPDEKTCTEEMQKWHIPRKDKAEEALLFEDLTFPQDRLANLMKLLFGQVFLKTSLMS